MKITSPVLVRVVTLTKVPVLKDVIRKPTRLSLCFTRASTGAESILPGATTIYD
jgi:hypothetical protein